MSVSATVPNAPEVTMARRGNGTARRLLARPGAAVSVGVLAVLVLSAVLAPVIARYGPDAVDPLNPLRTPGAAHWFGTDVIGRDLFSRMLYAGRLALTMMALATLIAMVLGVLWGGLAAMCRGLPDEVVMRLADGIMAIPVILTALILVAAFGASPTTLVLVLGVLHAPATARIARSAMLVELQDEYCVAAVAFGSSRRRILRAEVLPNIMPTLLVQASLVAASVMLTEAALSFVGLGIQPPRATWGTLLSDGYQNIYASYWFVVIPGIAIFATIWALNTLADNLQLMLDAKGLRP